jgi:surfeit locus 1 family protein
VWNVARRPRWIAMLVLCLAVAAGFALLGQWQLERSVDEATVVERDTETVQPIEQLTQPQQATLESEAGYVVSVRGSFAPGDFTTLSGRLQDGQEGYWLVGHLVSSDAASLAVALGWAEQPDDFADIERGIRTDPIEIIGRYLPSDSPTESDFEAGEQSALAVSELINQWTEVGDVYGGYVVLHEAPALELDGLQAIDSPEPTDEVTLNWLNIFYAAEWVIFAGFALYLWYRLVKDAWQREQEEAELAAQGATVE